MLIQGVPVKMDKWNLNFFLNYSLGGQVLNKKKKTKKWKYQKHACFGFNKLKTFDKDFK